MCTFPLVILLLILTARVRYIIQGRIPSFLKDIIVTNNRNSKGYMSE